MKIKAIQLTPFSGARSVDVGTAELYPGGIRSGELVDRQFVCFDPTTGKRMSSKPNQVPRLALIGADVGSRVLELSMHSEDDPSGRPVGELEIPFVDSGPDLVLATYVNEFGDSTPVYDMGNRAAEKLSAFLGKSVRLGQKTPDWLNVSAEQALLRANSPVHMVTVQTLSDLANILSGDGVLTEEAQDQLFAQLRAGLLLDLGNMPGVTWPKWAEQEWFNTQTSEPSLVFGSRHRTIRLTRQTVRCPVPGRDALTGRTADLDITKTYRQLPSVLYAKSEGEKSSKPVIGVYGAPGSVFEIEVGSAVHLDIVE